ncbi:hypothetical protein UlMin_027014 [Ulmus minor]
MNLDTTIETLANLPDIICIECKNRFIESMPAESHLTLEISSGMFEPVDDPNFCNQFLQVLRLITQAKSDEDTPHLFHIKINLRIELEGWDNNEDENNDKNGDEFHNAEEEENEILDWAKIFMGLDDNTLEFRLEVPKLDQYVNNPEDFVDAIGYEALLQTLAESDGSGRKGAPTASKRATLGLPTMEVRSEEEARALLGILGDEVWVWKIGKVCQFSKKKNKEKCFFCELRVRDIFFSFRKGGLFSFSQNSLIAVFQKHGNDMLL